MAHAGLLVQRMTLGQHLLIATAVALGRGHEADAAVMMFMVVPVHKSVHPAPRRVHAGKAALGPLRAVFQGAKQRFRVGVAVAVADARATARRGDPQFVHLAQQGHRFHRRAVVRVQHQRLAQAALTDDAALQQFGGLLAAFMRMDLPADALAAVDILDQVQVVILPAHRRGPVGDVPRPDFIGCRRRMAGGHRHCAWRLPHRCCWLAACRMR